MSRWALMLLLAACPPVEDTDDGNGRPDDETPADDVEPSDTDDGPSGPVVRVVTWNIYGVGRSGTEAREAAEDILERIDADVVALNEIQGPDDLDNFEDLASDLGYTYLSTPSEHPFGDYHNAFMSKLPLASDTWHTARSLSGDSGANDITRLIGEVTVTVDDARTLTLAVTHLKSGFDDADDYRRVVDAYRAAQVAAGQDTFALMGDMNYEIEDGTSDPSSITSLPGDVPSSYEEGRDVQADREDEGLTNDPFHYLIDVAELTALDALQVDGRDATRWESGRRLDYVLMSADLAAADPQSEIYDSSDEGQDGGLDKAGSAPDREVSEAASDHLPIIVDFVVE